MRYLCKCTPAAATQKPRLFNLCTFVRARYLLKRSKLIFRICKYITGPRIRNKIGIENRPSKTLKRAVLVDVFIRQGAVA